MQGGSLSKCGSLLSAAHIRLFATASWMESGPFSNMWLLPLAPHTSVAKNRKRFTDGGQVVFKKWFSNWRRAHLS
eukprot:9129121-Pyramimonas_sp.AAC.1